MQNPMVEMADGDDAHDVIVGRDIRLCFEMQNAWLKSLSAIIEEILEKYPGAQTDESLFRQALAEYNIEDAGWDWTRKAVHCSGDSYEWFYVRKKGEVQAACVTCHPTTSRFDNAKIVYVDYLSTAIWNRVRPGADPTYKGLGRYLLCYVAKHSVQTYGYRPGLSLHALPKAEGFYKKLGLTDFGIDHNKESLRYFEADSSAASEMIKEVQ